MTERGTPLQDGAQASGRHARDPAPAGHTHRPMYLPVEQCSNTGKMYPEDLT